MKLNNVGILNIMKVRSVTQWSVTSGNTAPSHPQLMVVGSVKIELLQNSPVTAITAGVI
jgi:hypothetical protein